MGEVPKRAEFNVIGVLFSVFRCGWPAILAVALFVVIQWPLMSVWWRIWMQDYSYYSHGPLVPFIVGYMVLGNRRSLAAAKLEPHWSGYVLMVLAGTLFVVAYWTQAGTLQALVFVTMIFAALLLMGGASVARLLSVPVLFLLTMMPMASSLLDGATGKFQLISAAIASKLFVLTGYSSTLSGATIYADGLPEPLIVGIPCSGLRTLISLITFTVFFVYVVRTVWWKKAILLALSFPLSVLINSLRIAMIGYAGFWVGTADAMHTFHDYSGYLGLIICFALLFGIAKLLGINQFGFAPGMPPRGDDTGRARPRLIGGGVAGVTVIVVLALAGATQLYQSPIYPEGKGRIARGSVPREFGDWTSVDYPVSDMVRRVLAKGDLMSRVYTDNSEYGRSVELFITASKSPEAFHDPHVCLPGGGSPISDDQIITLRFDRPRPMVVTATKLVSSGDDGQSVVIYWYMAGADSMPRTSDVWNRNRSNVVRDLAWLLMHPASQRDLRDSIQKRQFVWYRFSANVVDDEAADTRLLEQFIRDFVANTKGFGR